MAYTFTYRNFDAYGHFSNLLQASLPFKSFDLMLERPKGLETVGQTQICPRFPAISMIAEGCDEFHVAAFASKWMIPSDAERGSKPHVQCL
jgi:hypothetical protein